MDRHADGYYVFDIRSSDIDFADQLQFSSLFAYLQEAAYRHAEQLGIGTACLDLLDLSWVLTKTSLRIDHLPHWGEQIQVRTWSRGAKKLTFARDFIVSSGPAGGPYLPFARVSTEWLVIHKQTHRPQRPESVLDAANLAATAKATESVLEGPCPKVPIPAEREIILKKSADFSEIDRNRHLNNTRYIAWAIDALYMSRWQDLSRLSNLDVKPLEIAAIDLNYLAEILPGKPVNLSVSPDLTVEGMDPDTMTCYFRVKFAQKSDK